MQNESPRSLVRAARAAAIAFGLAVTTLAILAASALAAGTVTPTVDCVVNEGDGIYTAYFGYLNTTATSLTIDVGDNNLFIPGVQYQGQPTTLNVGSYPDVDGVMFDPTITPTVSWILNGMEATASATTPACLAATTGPASDVATASATLNAVVDPRGEPTSYYFDYGTTPAYGQTTAAQTSDGDDPSLGSTALSDLTAGTTYHYRVVASNAMVGTTEGQDETFTTPAAPVTPSEAALAVTEPASDLTASSVTLNGVINPQNQNTSYEFQWGTTTSYGYTTTAGSVSGADPQPVSSVISGLSPATTYHYRLIAGQPGIATDGADRTFTTPASTSSGTADLTLSTHAAPKAGVRGRALTYIFKLGNRGPATATSVIFQDLLSPGLSASRISARGGTCSLRQGVICRFAKLAPDIYATISVTVAAGRAGVERQVALVMASEPDPKPDNNFAILNTSFSRPSIRPR